MKPRAADIEMLRYTLHTQHILIPCLQLFSYDMRYACTQIHSRLHFCSHRTCTSTFVWQSFSFLLFSVLASRTHFRPTKIVEYYLLDHKSHCRYFYANKIYVGRERIFSIICGMKRGKRNRKQNDKNKSRCYGCDSIEFKCERFPLFISNVLTAYGCYFREFGRFFKPKWCYFWRNFG